MLISIVIAIVAIVIWYFPVFKQRKSDYFAFFYCMGILPPIRLILYFYGGIAIDTTEIAAAFIIFSSLFYKFNKIYFPVSLILSVIISFFSVELTTYEITLGKVIIYFGIIIYFIHSFILTLIESKIFNSFIAIMILLEMSTILKNITYLTDIKSGEVFFYITTIFQLLIGIYYSVFDESSHKIRI